MGRTKIMNSVRRSRIWSRTSRRKITNTFDQRMEVSRLSIDGQETQGRTRPSSPSPRPPAPWGRPVRIRLVLSRRVCACPDEWRMKVLESAYPRTQGDVPQLGSDVGVPRGRAFRERFLARDL